MSKNHLRRCALKLKVLIGAVIIYSNKGCKHPGFQMVIWIQELRFAASGVAVFPSILPILGRKEF